MVGENADSKIEIFKNEDIYFIPMGVRIEGKKAGNGNYLSINRLNWDELLFYNSLEISKIENVDICYEEEEVRNLLKNLGINLGDNVELHDRKNVFLYTDTTEVSDDIFQRSHITVGFTNENQIMYVHVISFLSWGIINDSGMFRRFDTYQGEDKIVTVKQAYDKLCSGEFYTAMPVDLEEMDEINLKVEDISMEPERDSRGCLEYVYCFYIEPITTPDGIEIDRVFVPAMKSYYE